MTCLESGNLGAGSVGVHSGWVSAESPFSSVAVRPVAAEFGPPSLRRALSRQRHSDSQEPAIPASHAPPLKSSEPTWMRPHGLLFCLNCHACPFLGSPWGTLVLFLLKVEGFGSTLERPQKPGRLLGTFSLEPFLGFRSGGMLVKELRDPEQEPAGWGAGFWLCDFGPSHLTSLRLSFLHLKWEFSTNLQQNSSADWVS